MLAIIMQTFLIANIIDVFNSLSNCAFYTIITAVFYQEGKIIIAILSSRFFIGKKQKLLPQRKFTATSWRGRTRLGCGD